MFNHIHNNYFDPTYPAYYSDFHRSKTILCFNLRQFVLFLIFFDIIFSSLGVSFGLIYLVFDYLSRLNLFQSFKFIQYIIHIPIGIFLDNRILFRSFWTIELLSKYFAIIFYLHVILNGLLLICSYNMYHAIKYHKPNRGLMYLIIKAAYFVHTTAIFIQWIVDSNREQDLQVVERLYGNGNFGFFSRNINIFCLGILEFLWKLFSMMIIFRSIQYLRDYRLQNQLDLTKTSSTTVVIQHHSNKSLNI